MQRQLTKQQELIEHRRRELERMSRKIDQRLALLHGALNADLDTISEIEEPELRCATLHERVNPTDAYSLGWHIRQLQQGQHETFAYLGNLGVGIAPERLAAATLMATTRSFCCSMTPMITWAMLRRDLPRAA